MLDSQRAALIDKVLSLQDSTGCWNTLETGDKYYPELNYYVPNYKSTLWTLILLAEIGIDSSDKRVSQPLSTIVDHFTNNESKIAAIGKSHFPIPCLNGNLLFLLSYFDYSNPKVAESIVDFFFKYQRFDDGDYKTPTSYPYFSNRSCYGKHTCYWGVVKMLKGLSYIKPMNRSEKATILIEKCVQYVLDHNICFSSRKQEEELCRGISKIAFPTMYGSDVLEILYLLMRESIKSAKIKAAINILREKQQENGKWKADRKIAGLIVPLGKTANEIISERAEAVLQYYGNM